MTIVYASPHPAPPKPSAPVSRAEELAPCGGAGRHPARTEAIRPQLRTRLRSEPDSSNLRAMQRVLSVGSVCLLACAGLACEDELVEETTACASGKRWIGDLTPSEEMYPGHDCVDCHKSSGGPELMAAGTVYGLIDEMGTRTTQLDCFGVEGARVTITAGDGQVLHTTTNRAGNFYFEGREDSLVKPLQIVVEYTLPDGRLSRQPMSGSPSYGGCAGCHHPDVESTPGSEAGRELGPDEVVRTAPIFTGPVHE